MDIYKRRIRMGITYDQIDEDKVVVLSVFNQCECFTSLDNKLEQGQNSEVILSQNKTTAI